MSEHQPGIDTNDLPVLVLTGSALRLTDIEAAAHRNRQVEISAQAWQNIAAGRACVDHVVKHNIPAYGITTGVGSQKDYAIGAQEAANYNSLLVRAHGSRGPAENCSWRLPGLRLRSLSANQRRS